MGGTAAALEDPVEIVERMGSAYARVSDYQVLVESTTYKGEAVQDETRILYRYKKPGRMRVEFLHPREGWVLVYPSEGGEVRVRPAGLLRFLKLDLDPDNSLLNVWPGQQVTQTDLGSLIENMAKSLSGGRLGPVNISRTRGELIIKLDAENHFQKGVPTRYEFRINSTLWLPTEVLEELLSTGRKRRIRFLELRTNAGFQDSLFQLP